MGTDELQVHEDESCSFRVFVAIVIWTLVAFAS